MKNKFVRSVFLSAFAAGAMALANVASAQCDLYPIAISANAIASIAPGTVIDNLSEGTGTGDFAWLTWTGDQSNADLLASLTGTGNSYTYVDPLGSGINTITAGKLVVVKNNAPDGERIRVDLRHLVGEVLTVPVWNSVTRLQIGTKHHQPVYETTLQVEGFIQIQIAGYELRPDNRDRLRILYLGYVNCGVITD